MTTDVTRREGITYTEHLRREIAQPGVICGPPVIDGPAWWQDLFPVFKPTQLRQLEAQAHAASAQWQAEAG